jgi:integrase
VHRVLRVALKAAVRRGKASRNVCDLFDPPTARKAHIPSLSVADTQAVVAAALVDDQAPRWLIALLLGMRQGEVLGLRWHRVDLEAGKLLVLRQAQRHTWQHGCEDPHACGARRHRFRPCRQPCARHQRPESCGKVCAPDCARHASICPQRWGGGIVEVDTKSDTGKQDGLPLVPVLVEMLRGWRERQIRERAELGRRWDPKGLVFTTVEGGPIDPRRDHTRWEQLLAAAGVEDHRLHAARHTAATLMVATGTDVTVVQEVLRHASVETARVYVDVASDMKRQAVERVAALLFDGALGDLLRTSTAPK